MLHCFVSLFSLTSYKKKYLLQEENVIVLIRSFPCSLATACHYYIPCTHVCEVKISICNRWELEEFKTTCKLVFNRFWKPLASSLYFLQTDQTKQNVTFEHINRSEQQQQKYFNAEIHLPNSNWRKKQQGIVK